MIISVAACRKLCPAEFAAVGFFSSVTSHVDLEVSFFEELEATVLALEELYFLQVCVPLMKPQP
jgi:hypothetical protein